MTKSELKQIADYIQDLSEGLHNRGYDILAMQTELPILYDYH